MGQRKDHVSMALMVHHILMYKDQFVVIPYSIPYSIKCSHSNLAGCHVSGIV